MSSSVLRFCNSTVSLLILMTAVIPVAHAADKLSARAEVNMRAGTERSILMTEFWAPLAQQNDRVLFGDLRLMGDNNENREGNLGFGYRQIAPQLNTVLGGHVWIDRRRTENNNHFHQLTLGLESLGNTIDLRTNAYIQLNNAKTIQSSGGGNSAPYLAGSGIFFNTNGFIIEEPQNGFEIEAGYRLPLWQKHIDVTRVYAGGYHFNGDNTKNTTGFRLRTEAQVNSVFSVGARFQHDAPRGSQGFIEATLRFPFAAKKLFQQEGLRARLDESPERDIDIVTGAKVVKGGPTPLLNANGSEQRILYVDNTNQQSGDGTKENPFNTLALAQATMQTNDIVYVNHGDGTTNGMDQGILLDKENIRLIGSGSALTYNGYTLIASGLMPLLTSTTGNTVDVSADNVSITGIEITAPDEHGIFVENAAGGIFNNVSIDNVKITTDNTGIKHPIWIVARNNSVIKNASVTNVYADSGVAIEFIAQANSAIENIIADNITTENLKEGILLVSNGNIGTATLSNLSLNNGEDGVLLSSYNSGVIDKVNINNLSATGNTEGGVRFLGETNSILNSLNITDSELDLNRVGVDLRAYTGATLDQVTVSNTSMNNNGAFGLLLDVRDGSSTNNISISNSTANSNTQHGISIFANFNSTIGNISIEDTNASNNILNGLYLLSENSSTVNNTALSNLALNNNGQYGFRIYNSQSAINQITGSYVSASANASDGLYIYSIGAASVVNNVAFSYSDFINNGGFGINLDQNSGTTFVVGLGGNNGNTGQNRLFGNGSNELSIYLNGGGTVFARNNWWGNPSGLIPARATLYSGVVVDSIAFLNSDPRP